MKAFNPLLSRKAQGLSPLPTWLFSLSEQRAILARKGLREVIVSNDHGVWHTVERIREPDRTSSLPTLDKDGKDLRGDRKNTGSAEDIVASYITVREKQKNDAHIEAMINKDLYRTWSETAVRKKIDREIKEDQDRYWRKQK